MIVTKWGILAFVADGFATWELDIFILIGLAMCEVSRINP
jgi:hypothetical protein